MTETMAMTETAEMVPAAVMTETAEVVAAEAMTETVEAAPETLPTTGGSSMPSLSVLASGLVLLVLVAAAFVTRRRTA